MAKKVARKLLHETILIRHACREIFMKMISGLE